MQTDRAIAWLLEKWGPDKKCPMCGTVEWEVAPIGGLSQFIPDYGFESHSGYPVVPVLCANCAFVALIHAVASGVVEATDVGEPI